MVAIAKPLNPDYPKQLAAIKIQRNLRGYLSRQHGWSFHGILTRSRVLKIQRVWRGYWGRKRTLALYQEFLDEKANMIILMFRAHVSRRVLLKLLSERTLTYVVRIQTLFRGRRTRAMFRALRHKYRTKHASRIQRYVRGYLGRCRWTAVYQRLKRYIKAMKAMRIENINRLGTTNPDKTRPTFDECSNWDLLHLIMCQTFGHPNTLFPTDVSGLLVTKFPAFMAYLGRFSRVLALWACWAGCGKAAHLRVDFLADSIDALYDQYIFEAGRRDEVEEQIVLEAPFQPLPSAIVAEPSPASTTRRFFYACDTDGEPAKNPYAAEYPDTFSGTANHIHPSERMEDLLAELEFMYFKGGMRIHHGKNIHMLLTMSAFLGISRFTKLTQVEVSPNWKGGCPPEGLTATGVPCVDAEAVQEDNRALAATRPKGPSLLPSDTLEPSLLAAQDNQDDDFSGEGSRDIEEKEPETPPEADPEAIEQEEAATCRLRMMSFLSDARRQIFAASAQLFSGDVGARIAAVEGIFCSTHYLVGTFDVTFPAIPFELPRPTRLDVDDRPRGDDCSLLCAVDLIRAGEVLIIRGKVKCVESSTSAHAGVSGSEGTLPIAIASQVLTPYEILAILALAKGQDSPYLASPRRQTGAKGGKGQAGGRSSFSSATKMSSSRGVVNFSPMNEELLLQYLPTALRLVWTESSTSALWHKGNNIGGKCTDGSGAQREEYLSRVGRYSGSCEKFNGFSRQEHEHSCPQCNSITLRLVVPVIEYNRQSINALRSEDYAVSVMQKIYRGFRDRALARRVLFRGVEKARQIDRVRRRNTALKNIRGFRYQQVSLIQARARGILLRGTLRYMAACATVIQARVRVMIAKRIAHDERIRQTLGPQVVEMLRRKMKLSGYDLVVIVLRCGANYKLVALDERNDATYELYVYRPTIEKIIDDYNADLAIRLASMPRSSTADERVLQTKTGKQQLNEFNENAPIRLWHFSRLSEQLIGKVRLAKKIVGVTKELGAEAIPFQKQYLPPDPERELEEQSALSSTVASLRSTSLSLEEMMLKKNRPKFELTLHESAKPSVGNIGEHNHKNPRLLRDQRQGLGLMLSRMDRQTLIEDFNKARIAKEVRRAAAHPQKRARRAGVGF